MLCSVLSEQSRSNYTSNDCLPHLREHFKPGKLDWATKWIKSIQVNPILVGGDFPHPQNFFSFDIQDNFLLINPHRYVTKIDRSSLSWLEKKYFGTHDINMTSSLKDDPIFLGKLFLLFPCVVYHSKANRKRTKIS